MRRTPAAPSWRWMCSQTAPMCGAGGLARGRAAPASSAACAPAGRRRAMRCQPRGARRCSRSSWPVFGVEQPHVQVVPLHLDALADPAGRRAVVGGLDFDAAIEMDGALAEAVVAKRLERQRPQRGPLLGKHRGDLALRRAVDARVGPVRLPAIEIGLRRLERLEAQALAAASSACGRCRLRLCPLRSGSPTRHGSATTP